MGTTTSLSDIILFDSLINQYARSFDQADITLASKIWSKSSEISFIYPRGGTEYGWEGIKNVIKMFNENFTARKLDCFDIKVANYGDFAWLEFHWKFKATSRFGNNLIQTKGRETQIWKKINDVWKLVHVHYSGLPVIESDQ